MKLKNKTEIISKILTPALKLWLRSQLDEVEELEININSGDAQILRGKINQVFLKTTRAIYQGIHVRKVQVSTDKIAINLGGIIKGKPLRLLQPIFVEGELIATEKDLNLSLSSPLLSQGLKDLIILLLEENNVNDGEKLLSDYEITWQNLTLNKDKFSLNGTLKDSEGKLSQLVLRSGLELENSQTLLLNPIYIEGIPDIEKIAVSKFTVDLGDEVELNLLNLFDQKIHCIGRAKVNN